jgi:hypothetical protein
MGLAHAVILGHRESAAQNVNQGGHRSSSWLGSSRLSIHVRKNVAGLGARIL